MKSIPPDNAGQNAPFNPVRLQIILLLLLIGVSILSLMSGPMEIRTDMVVKILVSRIVPLQSIWPETLESVIVDVRLPRLLAGLLIGAGLSISGAAFQGLFRNPLVSPHILGVSAGAGFGAALAILFFGNIFMVQLLSFSFGLIAVWMTYALSRTYRSTPVLMSAFPFRIKDIIIMGRAPHLSILASPSRADMEIAYKAMEAVGVVHLADRPCNSVSGGEWQLTLIARALVQEPQILLLDEPTSHLDMGNQMKILQVIKDLADSGMTIVMASHFPDHAFLVSSVVAILNDGRIAHKGSPDEVITEENMRMTYGVDVRVIQIEEGGVRKACLPSLRRKAAPRGT